MRSCRQSVRPTPKVPPATQAALGRRPRLPPGACFLSRSISSRLSRVTDRYSQPLRHAHKIGERCRRHFPHDVPSVTLQRDLADSEFSRRLFVEKSADYQGQNLEFASREVEIPSSQHPQFSARRPRFPVLRNRRLDRDHQVRSEEHTSELQSLMRISYAVFCLKKK